MDGLAQTLLGIPACFTSFARVIATLPGAGGLVSANALFNHKTGRFRHPTPDLFCGVPMALDSAGFVAMVRYWFYRWTLDQYVALAGSYPWIWWAAPDFCCEREVAHDRETVLARVTATAAKLAWTQQLADDVGVSRPMPVLQGWRPEDYERCAGLIARFTNLPNLVGLGSMCRRHLHGPDGAVAIFEHLDAVLPRHVRFHLFGVKGDVAYALRAHERIASLDSQAFEAESRREANKRRAVDPDFSCTLQFRTGNMVRWYRTLNERLTEAAPKRMTSQLALPLYLEAA